MTARKLNIPPPFEEAVRRHEREIMRLMLRMTGNRDDALDLFQETWLRAYRAYPRLDSASGLRPWLYRIATNLCRNHARNRARLSRVIADAGPDCAEQAVAAPDAHDGYAEIRKAVAELPEKQRRALLMRRVGGMDYGEIGAALKCSAQSARANVYLALKKLKARW